MVNGEYAPGQQIPTEQELMKQYNVSRITVRRAIQELINEKYLIKSQGKGTFVSQTRPSRELVKLKSFTEDCEDNHQVAKSQVLSVTVDKANKHDISRLGVSAEDKVIHITRLRFRDDVPLLIEHSYYPYPKYEFCCIIISADRSTPFERRIGVGSGSLGKKRGDCLRNGRAGSVAWNQQRGGAFFDANGCI